MKLLNHTAHTLKKGSTLTEMCVVLAVVSIVALAVVSFTTMVGARSAVGAAKLKMMEDRQLTKVILESWLNQLTEENAVITADENGLRATVDGEVFSVALEEELLTAAIPDGDPLFCPIHTLTRLTFDSMSHAGDAIYFCTAEYELPNPSGGVIQRSFTFALNPHIGDVYEEVGA